MNFMYELGIKKQMKADKERKCLLRSVRQRIYRLEENPSTDEVFKKEADRFAEWLVDNQDLKIIDMYINFVKYPHCKYVA